MLATEKPATYNSVAAQHDLPSRLLHARRRSDALFSIVRPESLYDRPIPERHRIIFYLGHLEAFDWNLLHDRALSLKTFHPEFDRLFAFGIDPVGGGLPSDKPSDWPNVATVREYVRAVRGSLDDGLANAPNEAASSGRCSLTTLLNVAIEHRLMHLETLAYMLHQLPLDCKIGQADASLPFTEPATPEMIEIPAGTATLGLSRASDKFGWDNEYESHAIHVPAFAIDRYKVTNRRYLEFIEAGGYETHSFWSDDWNWKVTQGISHPVFWRRNGGQWLYRGMFDEVPLPPDSPVYVSHAEAAAYARWAEKSLPSEAEWHRAALGEPGGSEGDYPWGSHPPGAEFGNFDFERWDPTPVNAFPKGRSAFGVNDIVGNGWEWTSTVLAPFAGFVPFPFYRGYSADFFDGKHFVMKGGSARTAACMLRRSFRNWFQAHYQYVYAGFRCVSR